MVADTVLELGAAADRLEQERDEARRELAESRRIWHEKRDELQAFCGRVTEELRVAKLAEETWRREAGRACAEAGEARVSVETMTKALESLKGVAEAAAEEVQLLRVNHQRRADELIEAAAHRDAARADARRLLEELQKVVAAPQVRLSRGGVAILLEADASKRIRDAIECPFCRASPCMQLNGCPEAP